MILAVDVDYQGREAVAAGVLCQDWGDTEPTRLLLCHLPEPADYIPGQFYRRELPPILNLLNSLERLPDTILIDGYVYLGRDRKPGLGRHLYDALDGRAAVIGTAKRRFKDTPAEAEIFRGGSRRPLYVTAEGILEKEARRLVAGMKGSHRIPRLLKMADMLSKSRDISSTASLIV